MDISDTFTTRDQLASARKRFDPFEKQKRELQQRAEDRVAEVRRQPMRVEGLMIRASRPEGEKPEVDPATGMPMPFTPPAALQKRRKEMMPQPVGEDEDRGEEVATNKQR